ncbi:MAG: methyltransferase domain-containing protein, partial [Candidatus Altiarchaeota archaeon]
DTYSVDSSKKACELVSKINPKTRCIDITRIDGKDYPEFKTILVIDVLEHIKDDKKALEKIRNLLGEKGRLVLSVPYHQLLWNKTDKYHYRRYSRKQLRKILEESGFTVKKMRLWNMLSLLPLILSKIFSFEVSHKKLAHSKINRLLTWYFIHFENKIPLPLGSQLFCLAEKR